MLLILLWASTVAADGFKPYPGAKVDAKPIRKANALGATAGGKTPAPKATIYTSADAYEKVYAFYRGTAKEYLMPGPAGNKRALPLGKEPKASFFIFHGAQDLMTSKCWAKIQRPYIGLDGKRAGSDLPHCFRKKIVFFLSDGGRRKKDETGRSNAVFFAGSVLDTDPRPCS